MSRTTPPAKPAPILKRSASHLDSAQPTTAKKQKVEFNPLVQVRQITEPEKSLELVKEEVRRALGRDGEAKDGQERYDAILAMLGKRPRSAGAPSGTLLKKYLIAFKARASELVECRKLVRAVIDLPWMGRSQGFVDVYIQLVTSLACVSADYKAGIMQSLGRNLAHLPTTRGRLHDEKPVAKGEMVRRVHQAIESIILCVPSADKDLLASLTANFPHESATTGSYIRYQRQLLQVAEYVPKLSASLLFLMTQRLVAIDVQIQQDIEDLDEEAEEVLLDDAGEEDDTDESGSDLSSESDDEEDVQVRKLRELRAKVAKMDETMHLLFDYYNPLMQQGTEPFKQLLLHFSTGIMAHRTRHAQFLIFCFAQQTQERTSDFVQFCLDIIGQVNANPSLRHHACAYLASFVARGAHVPTAMVREIFNTLCTFMEDIRKRCEPNCKGPDKRAFGLYYSVAQAIMYIFCFRWRDLAMGAVDASPEESELSEDDILADGRELEWLPGIKTVMRVNMHSPMNPLKVCSPVIVSQWAMLSHHLRFLYVETILEMNKRLRLQRSTAIASSYGSVMGRHETAKDRLTGEAHLQLDAYFPFDPYQLPKSKHWVEGAYNEWRAPAGMQRIDDDEDSEDDESESESEDDDAMEE
ncbi:RNA polymerase I-specific transcription initiation factor RRN3 [Piedraia hortae CBS 480.64]|uniref:RNA polymerase I-specific transcription initiation factor RRN3 n=1 Tax=Piedraia hortae CBS 480.64 TaxID=1314780 RepID=A0A6A7BS03_9PEZI|nr:RNA polymerase I-specific transcription initiation factor RRN3 [Piedraia hortae CBS 480.64]